MPCHPLVSLSPFFESPPPGFAICIQLFATGYEYSKPFFWAQSKTNLISASGRRGGRTGSCRRARCLTHMFHPGMNDWQVLALWHAGLFRVPYLWWENSPPFLPHPISSSVFFQPNLLLWVSAHGILSPLRLQQLLRTVRYIEIKWVSAAPWRNPTCLSASGSCCCLWSTLFCYPADSHRVQPGSCTCQPIYGVFQTSWLSSSLM